MTRQIHRTLLIRVDQLVINHQVFPSAVKVVLLRHVNLPLSNKDYRPSVDIYVSKISDEMSLHFPQCEIQGYLITQILIIIVTV